MTTAAFVKAVSTMKGVLPGMLEQLKDLAPKLTDKERVATVKQLSSLSKQVVALEQEHSDMAPDVEDDEF